MGFFLRQSDSKFGARKGIEELREFKWDDFLDEMKVHCPLLTSCLLGAVTSKSTGETVTLRSRPNISATPTIGTVMSILAYQSKFTLTIRCLYSRYNSLCRKQLHTNVSGHTCSITCATSSITHASSSITHASSKHSTA